MLFLSVALFSRIAITRQYGFRRVTAQSFTTAANDGRARLSRFFLPPSSKAISERESGHDMLLRAGYLRQSQAGIFHMLPLGQRVQEKLEILVDRHMQAVGASKVSLSSISPEALWKRTKRIDSYGQDLFRFEDRKKMGFLLAPTHEEEITNLVARCIYSYRDLPLRLYQIGRKYRDEPRPRHGLLRAREFCMKDLYTFDITVASAMETYEHVRMAYSRLFDELKLPYLVAEASSGDIGGDLSHEYHLPSKAGEDVIVSCDNCSYVANLEVAQARPQARVQGSQQLRIWCGSNKDSSLLYVVLYPVWECGLNSDINLRMMKSIFPEMYKDINTERPQGDVLLQSLADDPQDADKPKRQIKVFNLVGDQLDNMSSKLEPTYIRRLKEAPQASGKEMALLRIRSAEYCTHCEQGKLQLQPAIELGHTFHLGTRYSEPLEAVVRMPDSDIPVPVQMGCHGIGVSRIIGAVAEHLADAKGLNWPRAIAPFEVAIIPILPHSELETNDPKLNVKVVYDALAQPSSDGAESKQPSLAIDAVLDDRDSSFGWKMRDADTAGYLIIVVLGRRWNEGQRLCEVQCRRLGLKEEVELSRLREFVTGLLNQL